MSYKKPQPFVDRGKHGRCPVCGETSYSLSGVHPQCAMRQADQERLARIKLEKQRRPPPVSTPSDVKPWQRRCPKCKSVQHVRKKVCDCGHTFPVHNRPPLSRGE